MSKEFVERSLDGCRSKDEKAYRDFNTYEGNPPLSETVLDMAFELCPWGKTIDIVGLANVTNLARITERAVNQGYSRIRVFEPNRRFFTQLNTALFHTSHNKGKQNPTDDNSISFRIEDGAIFQYANGIQQRIAGTIEIQTYNSRYEDIAQKLPGCPQLTFVDKTFLHAQNPVKLLQSLQFGNPDRTIVLAGFGEKPIVVHANNGNTTKTDLADASWYPGTCPPNNLLLKDNANPIRVTERHNFYGHPKRRSGKTFSLDWSQGTTEVHQEETVFVRGKGSLPVVEEVVTKELWLSDGKLYAQKPSEHAQKILLGEYILEELIIHGKDIDTDKIKFRLPKSLYATLNL